MIAVGHALRRWHETHPSLAALQADGTPLFVRLVTDPDAQAAANAKAVLELRFGSTETRALVPFTVTETVTCAENVDLGTVVSAIVTALNGKAYLEDKDAAIHRLTMVSVRTASVPGLALEATIEWEGEASW